MNVARSPGDMLEELGCLEVDDINDDEVDDVTEGHTSIQAHDDNSQAEKQEKKSSNEEELMRHKEHFSGDVSSREIHSHEDQVLDDNEDPDVSDAELAPDLLKTVLIRRTFKPLCSRQWSNLRRNRSTFYFIHRP